MTGALRAFGREGMNVPVSVIAQEAGVGVATFYRSFRDRDALMAELETRAYAKLNAILDDIDAVGSTGVAAVEKFLLDSLALGDELVLPLHGAPPLVDPVSTAARQRIDLSLERYIAQARDRGQILSDLNATDVIMYSAVVSRPLRHGPDWDRSASRLIALFVAGMSSGAVLPGSPVDQAEVEQAFRFAAHSKPREIDPINGFPHRRSTARKRASRSDVTPPDPVDESG